MHREGKIQKIFTLEKWIVKMMEFVGIAKLTCLIRNTVSTLITDWKPLMDFFAGNGKNELLIYGFADLKRLNMRTRESYVILRRLGRP